MNDMSNDPILILSSGSIRGVESDGVRRFLGVPYAAAPMGERRFALPQPPESWEGVRDARNSGPIAPQPQPTAEELDALLPGLDIMPVIGVDQKTGDEHLVLNVWAPVHGENHPVFVFIHGGAFTGGAGSAPIYDGTALARAGVVCVTINYRLGVEGFLPIPGVPTNLGLRDQIAALKWVRDNIAAFGGDRDAITVSGESAGAMSLANLVVSPLAQGLFHRAIVQSGHGSMVRPIEIAQRLVVKLAKMLGVSADVDGFRQALVEDCVAALAKVSEPRSRINLRDAEGREPAFGLSRFLPVFGDDVLPDHPLVALGNGAGREIDLLIGTNRDEMNLYFVPPGIRRKIGRLLSYIAIRQSEPLAWKVLRAYRKLDPDWRPGDVFTESLTDLVFCLPARRYARLHQGRTHFYEFGWRSGAYGGELGACHAIELPFVFNTLATVAGPKGLAGENPPQELADRMTALWASYVRTGALPWPEYDAQMQNVYIPESDTTVRDRDMPADRIVPHYPGR
jgi:para-nitrobenzyl esterase